MVCHWHGLITYDGINWNIFNDSTSGFPTASIGSVAVDKNGIVWITCANSGVPTYTLWKYNGISWTQVTGGYSAIASHGKIYVDENNDKYFYQNGANLYKYNDTTWTIFTSATGQVSPNGAAYLALFENNIYSCGVFDDHVFGYDGNTGSSYKINGYDFAGNDFLSICTSPDNSVWFTSSHGIQHTNGIEFDTSNHHPAALTYDKIRSDNYGNIYVKTNLGLCKFDGNNWSVILGGVNIQTFEIAPNGDVWIGRGDTSLLIKYDGVGYQYFPFYDPLWPGMSITYSIAIDTAGNIWFADNFGFGKFNGASFTFYNSTTLSFLQPFNNFLVLSDKQGNIWISDSIAELVKYDGTTWTRYNSSNSSWPANTYVSSLIDEGNGTIWFGTSTGIVKFDGTTFINYDQVDIHMGTHWGGYDIAKDKNGNIWYASIYTAGVFTPGKILNLELEPSPEITGTAYFDVNTNGNLDTNDIGLPQQTILLTPDSIFRLSNSIGKYSFYADTGNYFITHLPFLNWSLTSAFNSYNVYADSVYNCCYDFGLQPQNVLHQMDLSLVNSQTRCNSIVPFWMDIYNSGTVPENVRCYFVKDTLIGFVNSTPAVTATSGDTLFWDFNACAPFSHHQILLQLQMPNQNNAGDTLNFKGGLTSLTNGAVLDAESITGVVTCAYDPNDKVAQPIGVDAPHYTLMNDTLIYTIRFPNTGTDTALTVAIYDTLNANLDMNTFHFLASSHTVDVKYNAKGRLRFAFYGIHLPDSNTDEIASHGFVRYSIKAKLNTTDYTLVNNTAYILFDFNFPVVTNTAFNTLVYQMPVGLDAIQQTNTIHVYPNPAKDRINFKLSAHNKNFDLIISDLYGRQIYHSKEFGDFASIATSRIGEGVFVYRINDQAGKVHIGKFILIK